MQTTEMAIGDDSKWSLTRHVAEASVHQVPWESMPSDIQEIYRHCLIDWLGVTLRGSGEPVATVLYCDVRSYGGNEICTAIGYEHRVSMLQAALINGAASHALDYDDVHLSVGHPTVAILPALMALAEAESSTGMELAEAYVAGHGAACVIGQAMGGLHYEKGFHTTATIGTLGAAVGCAHLLKLPTDVVQTAIGIAATQAAGLKTMFGSMCKPFHAGRAARDGLHAARLAGAGFTATPTALDGPIGFLAALHGSVPTARLVKELPDWPLRQNLFKYHAACYLTHAAIDSVLGIMRQHRFSSKEIGRVVIRAKESINTVCNIRSPRDGLELKFSIEAVVAMALSGLDTASPDSYSTEHADVVAKLPFRDRIVVEFEPARPSTSIDVEIHLESGQTLHACVDSGVPANDLYVQREKLQHKFHALTERRLSSCCRDDLVAMVFEGRELPSAKAIFARISSTH